MPLFFEFYIIKNLSYRIVEFVKTRAITRQTDNFYGTKELKYVVEIYNINILTEHPHQGCFGYRLMVNG